MKYIQLLSSSLKKFTRKTTNTWNYQCPLCSDGDKDSRKSRGYILHKKGNYYSYCHNCHASSSFPKFLEIVNPLLYNDYIVEKYSGLPEDKRQIESIPMVLKEKSRENKILLRLPKISLLDSDHFAKKYVVGRQIPTFYHSRLYYTENFNAFANELVDDEDKFDPTFKEPRLVIPMFDKQKRLIGVQGRALSNVKDKLRYITALVGVENRRFFGLDLVKFEQKYYIFEGPIDSMFIPNSIAVCGGAIHSEIKKHNLIKQTCVAVYDNEPRNIDVVKNMKKLARRGYKVCVWPENTEHKDVNNMILARLPNAETVLTEKVQKAAEYIKQIIDDNTFEGLSAEARITEWSKINARS